MSRPAGVTVSAVFLSIGSLLAAVSGVFFFFAQSLAPPDTPRPPFAEAIMVFTAAVFFGSALWGTLTAFGLIRMYRWARISILVIGTLLVIFCGLSLLMLLAIPQFMPESESTRGMGLVTGIMTTLYLIPIAFGIWWLIYFNRAPVKAAFVAGAPATVEAGPRRPLSIAIIAWHAIAFGLMTVPGVLTQFPAIVFGILLTGWGAKLVYLLFGVTQFAIGIGLLKLRPWGHTAAVWFCIFVMVHSVVFAFLPDKAARFAEMVKYYPPEFRADTKALAFAESFLWLGEVFTWVTFGTVLWFLFTRKKAFLEAGKAKQVAAA